MTFLPMILLKDIALSASHRALMKVMDRVLIPEDPNKCMAGMILSNYEL
tara:strand:- start:5142 stop:5288 length:147 start_codon:yes stop_codon:yes gene_type:complete